jgi:glycosyltransferase involved in cell wall biosynthesis
MISPMSLKQYIFPPLPGNRRVISNDFIPGLVSVIIPAFQARWCIEDAIQSVIDQTYPHIEIIVIDDGSLDGTGELIKKKYNNKVIYKYQCNSGLAATRNMGLIISKGEYIQFLDADDTIWKEKIFKQINYLKDHPTIGIVTCLYKEYWDENEKPPKHSQPKFQPPTPLPEILLKNSVGIVSAPLIRRTGIVSIGGFDESFHNYCADWEFWLSLALMGVKFDILYEELADYHRHRMSLTGQMISPNALGDLKVSYRAKNYLKDYPEFTIWKIDEIIAFHHEHVALALFREGKWKESVEHASKAYKMHGFIQKAKLLGKIPLFLYTSKWNNDQSIKALKQK